MSFKDAFTKEGAGGNPLNYDDSAFAYFASTCPTCALLIWGYTYFENRLHVFSHLRRVVFGCVRRGVSSVRRFVKRRRSGEAVEEEAVACEKDSVECKCSLCARKNQQLMAETPLIYRFIGTSSDYLQLIGLTILAGLVLFIGTHYLSIMPNVATFNPWTILNITEAAGEREIRKAFRTMSLKYHPDKNPNDAGAAAQFLLISKAYNTLTNEVARRNFEKYGNPDGRTGMMKVGIGLPTFMLSEDFQIFILAIFFITLLVIVPGCFLLYYYYISQFAHNGLKKDTVHLLGCLMTQKIHPHRVVALIAASREMRDLGFKATTQDINLLSQKCSEKSIDPLGTTSVEILECCWLIYVHLARQTHTLPTHLQKQTRAILREAIKISRAMLDIAFINNWIPAIQVILAVRKCLLQSVEIGSLPLTQIPHVLKMSEMIQSDNNSKLPQYSLERSKHLLESMQRYKPTDFRDLVKVALENKQEALSDFTNEEIEDIRAVYATLPKIKFEGTVFVDDEAEICLGDAATCRLTFTREHLKENEVQGYIHSPFYPDHRKEEWFAFISDSETNELHGYKTFTDNSRTVVIDILFPVLKVGTWKMTAVVLSEAYFGVDRSVDFTFTAIHPQESSRKEFVHPDDVALDNQTSLVQQLLGTAALAEDEEDEDDEDTGTTHQKGGHSCQCGDRNIANANKTVVPIQ